MIHTKRGGCLRFEVIVFKKEFKEDIKIFFCAIGSEKHKKIAVTKIYKKSNQKVFSLNIFIFISVTFVV